MFNKTKWLEFHKRFKETRFSKFFRSVRVAIGIIVVVVLASILGTIFIQNGQPEEYIRKFGESGFFWIRLLSLDDVYHAWWYKLLLVVLTIATVTCLGSRLNMKLVKSGSLFVHINIVTILVGIVVARFGEKGFLQVFEGDKSNQMIVDKGFVKNPMTGKIEKKIEMRKLPFEIALHDFYITRYKEPQERLFVLDDKDKVVKSFSFEPGKLIKLPKQKMGLSVLETLPHAHLKEKVIQDPNAPFFPAVNLTIDSPQGKADGWLFSHKEDYLLSPDRSMYVHYQWYESEEQMKIAIREFEANTEDPRHKIDHVFQVASGKDFEPRVLHFEKGKFIENHVWAKGTPIYFDRVNTTFSPIEFIDHARIETEVHNDSDEFINPAIRLAVGTPESGIQSNWLFANRKTQHLFKNIPYQFYYSVDFPIKEYVSEIKVIDNGREVMRKSLRVNHPLKFKGYRLYQASYDKENEKWSGIQVTRDPGMPIVFIGFIGMMIGLILMFYVNPLLNKNKEPESEETAV